MFSLTDVRFGLVEGLASLRHDIACAVLDDKRHFLIQLTIPHFDLFLTVDFKVLLATRLGKYFFKLLLTFKKFYLFGYRAG